MANKLINIILFLVFTQSVNAQISFFKTYGENGFDFGHGIVQLADSSYVITGSSSSFQDAPSRAFMLKVDSMGQYIWSRSFGGNNSDLGRRIFHRENEGFWIAGYSNSFSTNANFDFYLIKTDETGEPEWEKTYGTPDWERLWDAVLLADNGLILVGETDGLSSLEEDIYMVRTDALGDTVWTKRLQSNQKDIAYSCVLLNDTTFVIAGCHGYGSDSKGFVSAFHIDGSPVWETELSSNHGSFISQLQMYNGQIFGVGSTISTTGENRPWAVKLDEFGDLIDEIVESSLNEHYNNLAIRDDDSFFVSDYVQLADNEVELLILQWHTLFYFFEGFTAQLPLFGKHICNQMIVSNDGGIIYLGELSDPNSSQGGSHVSFLKLGPNEELVGSPDEILPLVNLSEYIISSNGVYPFPNPFVDIIEFNEYNPNLNYRLLDVNGKLIAEGNVSSEISTIDLKKGLYFLEISGNDTHEVFKLIKN